MTGAILDTSSRIKVRIEPDIAAIEPLQWNRCAHGDHQNDDEHTDPRNPFISAQFLTALQISGSAIPETGWAGAHILFETPEKTLIAAVPCYLKNHSMGEYVFDHNWADAYSRVGGRYYPKLQISVPFTPATGRRMLIADPLEPSSTKDFIADAIKAVCVQQNVSSAHLTFLSQNEANFLATKGFLTRTDQQFHWINESYAHFDDFLTSLHSRKRKLIKRERRDALGSGISIERLTGAEINEQHLDAFFSFYLDTGSRKWGNPYLTRSFFSLIRETMADQILLILAKRDNRYIAGAINFIGQNTLYGRNWGCIEDHPFLHFEVCYYQAIDFAIERGLKRIEAGAQGEHKLARGYRPVTTYSAHYFVDPNFRRAVESYLGKEREYVASLHSELADHTPFKKNK